MNRKLQHSVTALTATAAVFGLLLLAGGPPRTSLPLPTAETLVSIEDPAMLPAVDAEADTVSRRHQRRARTGLALPYFSFAQGLRNVAGG